MASLFTFSCVWAILYRPVRLDLGYWLAALFLATNGLAHLASLGVMLTFDSADLAEQSTSNQFYSFASTKISFILFPVIFIGAGIFYLTSIVIQLKNK